MKKMYHIAGLYLIYGLCAGLFSHEAAYWTQFSGETVMSVVHTHALTLGTAVFFILPLFMKAFPIENQKSFHGFVWIYNIGLVITLGFMSVRGITQLFAFPVSSFWDHMIGGLAGIGHIILTIGLGFLFHALIKSCEITVSMD